MANPIILVKLGDPINKPQLFACPKCGKAHSWKIYACTEDVAMDEARKAAENCYECRTHNICTECGKECEKLYTARPDCRRKKKLARCTTVPASEVKECYGFDSDQFYYSVEEAIEDGCALAHPAELRHFNLDPERVLESILDDHFEDASESDLKGVDALYNAIEKFNAAQTSGTYDPITDKVADLSSISHLSQKRPGQ